MFTRLQAWFLRKRLGHIQLQVPELAIIIRTIRAYPGCRLLVFGLGNDTPLWLQVNRRGTTVFLEDYDEWFTRITEKYPQATAFKIDYPHDMTEWRELLDQPDEELNVELPDGVPLGAWDVVLVDGPRGYKEIPEHKGRMSSIYMATKLVAAGGRVFVHDADRAVEKAYAAKYLRDENLLKKVRGHAWLYMYRAP